MGEVTLLQDNKVAIEIKGGQHAPAVVAVFVPT